LKPFLIRLGTAFGLSVAAALACALPAALRVSASGVATGTTTGRIWIALAAADLLPMLMAVVVLRGAREGLRALAGEGAGLRAWGLALWVALQFVVLTVVGAVLRATTHQHALAAVTHAFAALAVAIGSALVCARIVAIVAAAPPRTRRALLVLLSCLALVAVAAVGMRFLRAVWREPTPSPAAATVVDVLAFGLAALFGSRPSFALRRSIGLLGVPAAVVVFLAGLPVLRDPVLRRAVHDRAPLLAPIVEVPGATPQ
jgi:hypothetical protein